jgi:polyferredoxin
MFVWDVLGGRAGRRTRIKAWAAGGRPTLALLFFFVARSSPLFFPISGDLRVLYVTTFLLGAHVYIV